MRRILSGVLFIIVFIAMLNAAGIDRLKQKDFVLSNTDKIILVKCTTKTNCKATKLNIPEQLFDLCISSVIVYDKDTSKGAIVKMRVPVKYVKAISAKVLQICPECMIIGSEVIPVPTPTRTGK